MKLVYDCPSLKEVDFVKMKPIEFKTNITHTEEGGDDLSIEIRIKVLTSQLEDMFFRVIVKMMDANTNREHPELVCITHPIRVVSKPDQVINSPTKKGLAMKKKRKRNPTSSENVLDSIGRIEYQQRQQHKLLKKLLNGDSGDNDEEGDGVDIMEEHVPSALSLTPSVNDKEDSFRNAFTDFLASFKHLQTLDISDGSYKINTSAQDAQSMCELLEMIRKEINHNTQEKGDIVDLNGNNNVGSNPPLSAALCEYDMYSCKQNMEMTSMYSAGSDTSITSCSMPLMTPFAPTRMHEQQPPPNIVSTDLLDASMSMGTLFDINMINSFGHLPINGENGAASGSGVSNNIANSNNNGLIMNNSNGYNFPNFGEMPPLSMFTTPTAL